MAEESNDRDPASPGGVVRQRSGPLRVAVARSLGLLSPRSRRRYWLVVGAQMATSLLDLAGVILVGFTVVFAYSVPAGVPVPSSIETLVTRLGLEDVPPETLALGCGALAAGLLLSKSVLNAVLLRRIFVFLARRQSEVSSRLARAWFTGDVHGVHSKSDVQVEQALTQSVHSATVGLLGATAVALSEVSLLILLSAALLLVDPIATLLAASCFIAVSLLVHRVLSGWSSRVGQEISQHSMSARSDIRQSVESFRELRTSHRLGFPLARFEATVAGLAQAYANAMFINNVPKVAYEAALVAGAVVLVAWQVGTGDVASALALLAVFLTAAARLLPSMVRLQGQLAFMGNYAGQAGLAFELAEDRAPASPSVSLDELGRSVPPASPRYDGFEASVIVDHLTVTYPGRAEPTLQDISLRVDPGQSLVLVGSTGAGKSTLVDVILGFTQPGRGTVLIGGHPPIEALRTWPGAVAYMPQNCLIWGLSVRDNVALGLPRDCVDDDAVWRALEQAHLADDVRSRGGLDYLVGPSGRHLSGGQRQRLGIARALYSQPRLLVLDEATSALDEETEALIGGVLEELRGEVTVIAVAHRRTTIERADTIAVVEGGSVTFIGPPGAYLVRR